MRELNKIHLSGLRAIEATGRLGTLAAAADELGVTSGALSQRIQKAERALGRVLFKRTSNGLVLTVSGAEMMPLLTRGLTDLSSAVGLMNPARDNCLTISVAPVFASRWLVWRLGRFNALHPKIRIRIEPSVTLLNPDHDDVDICVRVGSGEWPDVNAEFLLEQRVFPVCSPEFADRISEPADLAGVPIIRENEALYGWDFWLKQYGLAPDILGAGPTFADASLCLDAAMTGQGVFMAWETLASDAVKAGRIAAPFQTRVATTARYCFVTGRETSRKKIVAQFRTWLRDELADSVRDWNLEG